MDHLPPIVKLEGSIAIVVSSWPVGVIAVAVALPDTTILAMDQHFASLVDGDVASLGRQRSITCARGR